MGLTTPLTYCARLKLDPSEFLLSHTTFRLTMILTPIISSVLLIAGSTATSEPLVLAPAFPLLELIALEDADGPKWEGSVTLGSSMSAGNTEVTTVTGGAEATRTGELNKWTFGLTSVYAKDADEVTQRRNEGAAKYDHDLNESTYVYGSIGAMSDGQADLDLRMDISAGGGYKVWTEGPWTLDTELGLAHLSEDFGSGQQNQYVALRGGYGLKWQSENEDKKFAQTGSLNPSLDGGSDGYYRLDSSLKMNLSDSMFTKLQWVYDHTANPAAGKDKNDHLLLVTLGWSF